MESYDSLIASGLTRIQPTPIVNGRVPPPSAPSMGRALVGTIPLEMQLDADFAENQYGGQVPSYRLMPPASSGQAAVNSAAQSTQIVIQQSSASSGLLLETNGIKNSSQSVLNLQGTAVVGSDAAGNVTIDGGGDGLIHGDSIWEIDPACIYYRDDFNHLDTTTLAIGDFGWATDISVSTIGYFQHATPHLGCVGLVNGSSAGCSTIYWPVQGTNTPWGAAMPLLDYPPWKMIFVFSFDQAGNFTTSLPSNAFSMTKKSFYMGCQMNLGSPTNTRPTVYFGLRYDTDTTSPSIGDTTFWFEGVANSPSNSRVNTQGTTYNTGVTPANGNWYRFEMLCTVAGEVQFTLVDETNDVTVTKTLTIPQFSQTLSDSQTSGTLGLFSVTASNYQYTPYGGKVTLSGMTHIAGLNGVQTLLVTSGPNILGSTSLSTVANGSETGHVTGNFGCIPFVTFGNDTEASPVANVTMNWDFFSFAWNPGVGGGTATPNPLKSRYF